jgi:hypothetical protein
MRWTVAVFAAALVIFVAATVGVTDDGQAGGRLGDDERLNVTFEADIPSERPTQPDGTDGSGGGAVVDSLDPAPDTEPPEPNRTDDPDSETTVDPVDTDDWAGGWPVDSEPAEETDDWAGGWTVE